MLNALSKLQLLLASKSPRRQQLLQEMGFSFQLVHQDIEETYPSDLAANNIAAYLAEQKAQAVKAVLKYPSEVILTADTTVVKDGISYEKPVDTADARRILKALSGGRHQVITAVCLLGQLRQVTISDSCQVYLEELSDQEIDYYIEQHQPFDKAGAYAIQEWIGLNKISKIEGSFFTVVGLPTQKVYSALTSYVELLP